MSGSRIVKFVAPNRAVLIQHIIATVALIIAALAVLSVLRPFDVLGFRCSAPLLGAKMLHSVPFSSNLYGQGPSICHTRASYHLITAIIVFVLAITAGIGGWVLPLGLPWWMSRDGVPPRKR